MGKYPFPSSPEWQSLEAPEPGVPTGRAALFSCNHDPKCNCSGPGCHKAMGLPWNSHCSQQTRSFGAASWTLHCAQEPGPAQVFLAGESAGRSQGIVFPRLLFQLNMHGCVGSHLEWSTLWYYQKSIQGTWIFWIFYNECMFYYFLKGSIV